MFKTPLIVQADATPDIWIVYAPLVWTNPTGDITVPVGFKTDLASIPRLLRNIPNLDPCGLSRRAAVLHDYLYTLKTVSKDQADSLLYQALRAESVDVLAAQAFYDAVHMFGFQAWNNDQRG